MPAQALDVAGINFADSTSVAGSELKLNGAGLRTRFAVVKVYAIGLYLPQKTAAADAVLASTGARRVQITTLRDLTAEQLTDALIEALEANHSTAEMSKLAPRVAQLRSIMLSIGKVAEKTSIRLDYLPASGTRVIVGNEQKGSDIAGEDFFVAVLKIWLGNKPVQADLKDQLLGKT
ncbi:chalcone isomerase family protein [Viridibacterium curvum]|uniref:Chalcone isomerase family protein n=1 Tax=Viridibacterium curvum TaxID=1101404 RepID=A0ABP9R3Z5_9RHOO